MGGPFRTARRVEFGDTDMAGICHFANFFRFMEAAETDYLRARGLSVAWQADGQRVGFPRRAVACEFFKPARFEDVLTVEVTLKGIGRTSVTYQFEFTREGELIARGTISAVCCRTDGPGGRMEAVEIPPDLRARLGADG